VNRGRDHRRSAHHEPKIDIAPTIQGISNCIEGAILIELTAVAEGLIGSRVELADDPTRDREHEEHPPRGHDGDQEVYREVGDVARPRGRAQGPADDVNRNEEREAIEDGAQEADGKLDLEIVFAVDSSGIFGKGGEHSEPVAGQVDGHETEK
jgi:hypothetical protein